MKTKIDKIKELEAKKKASKIMDYIDEEDPEIQAAAIEALGNLGYEEAADALQSAIRNEDYNVRMATAKAFQKIGSSRVAEALHHQMLHETDPELKKEFEKAMDFTRDRKQNV